VRPKVPLPPLTYGPDPSQLADFLLKFENLVCKLSAHAFTDQDKYLALISKLHPKTFAEIRSERIWRSQTDNYTDKKVVLQEKVKEDMVDEKLSNPKRFSG